MKGKLWLKDILIIVAFWGIYAIGRGIVIAINGNEANIHAAAWAEFVGRVASIIAAILVCRKISDFEADGCLRVNCIIATVLFTFNTLTSLNLLYVYSNSFGFSGIVAVCADAIPAIIAFGMKPAKVIPPSPEQIKAQKYAETKKRVVEIVRPYEKLSLWVLPEVDNYFNEISKQPFPSQSIEDASYGIAIALSNKMISYFNGIRRPGNQLQEGILNTMMAEKVRLEEEAARRSQATITENEKNNAQSRGQKKSTRMPSTILIVVGVLATITYLGGHIYLSVWGIQNIDPPFLGWVALFLPAGGDLLVCIFAIAAKAWHVIIPVIVAPLLWLLGGAIARKMDEQ